MSAERLARLIVIAIAVGLPIVVLIASGTASGQAIELHGRVAETGGWTPADLTAKVGEPIHLRLTSDDVLHGFAIGQSDRPAIDVKPGEVAETTLVFDKPGKYTFYCTRWCGPNHWRMRGTIEVSSEQLGSDQLNSDQLSSDQSGSGQSPLYVTLGLDIDAPHPAEVVPEETPSAERGAALGIALPAAYRAAEYYRSHSPVEVWKALRAEPFTRDLSDRQVWDLVAFVWRSHTTPVSLAAGRQLFAENCAACHGETGSGDGVMAESLTNPSHAGDLQQHDTKAPAKFSDAGSMLGASPALLHGKIVRGGMGTGMPYWGPIFTERQVWAIVGYLWTFQFR